MSGLRFIIGVFLLLAVPHRSALADDSSTSLPQSVSKVERQLADQIEATRIETINKVVGSVVAIYGQDRQGGGSGVIINPNGIALTNHHVIAGAGVEGLGGLADGQLYPWELLGTDPGGDLAVIRLKGEDPFPFSPLGDSDTVRVGDWALAMGNPFLLAEDHVPTVTLGIVSGVQRYQEGAGQNQLVYGNCIQVDSSINPGNSGGPLFNMRGEVIGINGRASFQDRGRVNVGLGYAISANQIKNFLPDLLATKLVEHATLDAGFGQRKGKVVCSMLDRESPAAKMGLDLGDELIEFEGTAITSANQFTNLICTLPEDWPVSIVVRKPDGRQQSIYVRAFGLPYPKVTALREMPGPDDGGEPGEMPHEPSEQQKKRQQELQQKMIKLLSAEPGTVRDRQINTRYASAFIDVWAAKNQLIYPHDDAIKFRAQLFDREESVGQATLFLHRGDTGTHCRLEWSQNGQSSSYLLNENRIVQWVDGKPLEQNLAEARRQPRILWATMFSWLSLSDVIGMPNPPFSGALIDGAGKSDRKAAWRLRAGDDSPTWDEPFWLWMHIDYRADGWSFQLSKISMDKDCRGGGVMFRDWQDHEGVNGNVSQFPREVLFVTGLEEQVSLRMTIGPPERIEADEVEFDLPVADDAPKR